MCKFFSLFYTNIMKLVVEVVADLLYNIAIC